MRTRFPEKIVINADDFGLNPSVNSAIIESFDKGLINSATLMANMPGFDEAVALSQKHNIQNKIGIHLTLTEGVPLTSNIQYSDIFCDLNKVDIRKYKRSHFFLAKQKQDLVFKEFSAQIEKVRNAGIQITHIDTHQHIHEIWAITRIIMTSLRRYDIPSMRILNNLNRSTNYYKSLYRWQINNYIRIKNANHSDFFGDQLEVISQLKIAPKFCNGKKLEIMVHPDYNESGIIIDKVKNKEYNLEHSKELRKLIF